MGPHKKVNTRWTDKVKKSGPATPKVNRSAGKRLGRKKGKHKVSEKGRGQKRPKNTRRASGPATFPIPFLYLSLGV